MEEKQQGGPPEVMKKYFSIGEMAKMHGVAQSTLRYYDELGMFKPAYTNPDNGYRYYSISQFGMLDTIKFLKHMGIPLKDIHAYLEQRTPELALRLMEKQEMEIVQKQFELKAMADKIKQKINMLRKGFQAERSTTRFLEIPRRTIASIGVEGETGEDAFELYLNRLQGKLQSLSISLFSGDVGVSVAQASLLEGKYDEYQSLFILLDHPSDDADFMQYLPEGTYACRCHYGPYEQAGDSYRHLLKDIEMSRYEMAGDAVEIGLIDLAVTADSEQYVTELQIPVRLR